jgi:DNA repair protein RecO (recombination protein O)
MHYSLEAITLGTIKYGDSSLIAACYTKQHGLQSYILKGILTTRGNKKNSKSLFEPLNLLELEAPKNPSDRLGYIKEAKLNIHYSSIPFDLRKKALIFFLAEVIHQVVKEEHEANEKLFDFLREKLLWLDNHQNISLFHVKMMLDLTKFIGFYPNTNNSSDSYFNLESGCMSSIKPYGKYLEGKIKTLWFSILGMEFGEVWSIKITKEDKKTLLNSVVNYYEIHLQQFKPPKSTEILNEIFKSA